jgi:hypothetical protein
MKFFVHSIGNVNAVERLVFKFTRKFAGVKRIVLVHFFFVGSRDICGVDDDTVNMIVAENSQCTETAEAGFVDDLINAIGIMFL